MSRNNVGKQKCELVKPPWFMGEPAHKQPKKQRGVQADLCTCVQMTQALRSSLGFCA